MPKERRKIVREVSNNIGQELADALCPYKSPDMIIFGIPPEGAVLAAQIAKILNVSLAVIVSEEICHPYNPTLSIGAVAPDGHYVKNSLDEIYVDPANIKREIVNKQNQAKKCQKQYGKLCRTRGIEGRTIVLVDNYIENGFSFSLAISELLHYNPKKIIAAIPVVPFTIAERIRASVDSLVALEIPIYNANGTNHKFESISHEDAIRLIKAL